MHHSSRWHGIAGWGKQSCYISGVEHKALLAELAIDLHLAFHLQYVIHFNAAHGQECGFHLLARAGAGEAQRFGGVHTDLFFVEQPRQQLQRWQIQQFRRFQCGSEYVDAVPVFLAVGKLRRWAVSSLGHQLFAGAA